MSFMRMAAVALAFVLVTGVAASAQPKAAPTGPAAQSQELNSPDAAPTTDVDVTSDGPSSGPPVSGISIVALFKSADIIVKAVMTLLVLASLWSWAIIINKSIALGTVRRKADRFEKTFWSGMSLDELYQQFAQRADHPLAAVFMAGVREWRRAFEHNPPSEAKIPRINERIDKAMSVTILRETDGLERQLGFLATVGATAPFVGLFGTVWGIMNSFSAIAARHDTTLATVAPGIAEALFATAMGLLAAIPAVIFYNKFVNDIGRYSARLEGFADELSAILSRQLDEKAR